MSLGQGVVIATLIKQKLNTKSLTKAEVVGVDDVLDLQIWTRRFINAQCKHADQTALTRGDKLYQDNTSAIKLEVNGKKSSTKQTRHIDNRYFSITDRVKSGKVDIEYCPTEDMVADFFTKPLQGSLFRRHRNTIQGITEEEFESYKESYAKAKQRSD